MKKPSLVAVLLAASAVALAGCSTAPASEGETDTIQITASTNVYGSLAAQIGGDRVEVTSIIDSVAQDPHTYEATARDRLAVQSADLVIENGGGYDTFMQDLLEGSDAAVLTAAKFSRGYTGEDEHAEDDAHSEDEHAEDDAHSEDEHADEEADHNHDHDHDHGDTELIEPPYHDGHSHIHGFNEHVWFDLYAMLDVVDGMTAALIEIDPAGEAQYRAAAEPILDELRGFENELANISTMANDASVFITEPLPSYIASAARLTDLTPDGFAEAVEEGRDVPPATLLAALEVIDSGEVSVVFTNAQTGGPETQRVEEAAEAAGIPVIAFTELLDSGASYSDWMRAAIQSLADALRS